MTNFVIAVTGAKTASLISRINPSDTPADLSDGQFFVKTQQDLIDNLTIDQMVSLYNEQAPNHGKNTRKGFKTKPQGAGQTFELLFDSKSGPSLEENEQKTVEKVAQKKAIDKEKKSKKLDFKAEKTPRKRKPDTKFAKLAKMFSDNPGKKFDREAIMKETGYSETSLIVRISKLRTNYMEANKDHTQGGPEFHIGMNIVKYKEDQTWSYEPKGNKELGFMKERLEEILKPLLEMQQS